MRISDWSSDVCSSDLETLLRKAYWKMGAILMPMSFTVGKPGADIHYAATLPMRSTPEPVTTNRLGEVSGLKGLHIVDGARSEERRVGKECGSTCRSRESP